MEIITFNIYWSEGGALAVPWTLCRRRLYFENLRRERGKGSPNRGARCCYTRGADRAQFLVRGWSTHSRAAENIRISLCSYTSLHIFSRLLGRPGPPNQGFGEIWWDPVSILGRIREGFGKDHRTGVLGAPRCGVCKSGPVLHNGMARSQPGGRKHKDFLMFWWSVTHLFPPPGPARAAELYSIDIQYILNIYWISIDFLKEINRYSIYIGHLLNIYWFP